MTTTTKYLPTTIDLAPILNLRPEVAAMTERLRACEPVPEIEYDTLTARITAAGAALTEQLVGHAIEMQAFPKMIETLRDEVGTAVDAMVGGFGLTNLWEEIHAEEIATRQAWFLVTEFRAEGHGIEFLLDLVDTLADELPTHVVTDLHQWIRSLES